MDAILQISTGLYGDCTISDISLFRQRLEGLLQRMPVRGVIFGWGRIPGLFESLVETAHRYGVKAYLWMPCFADTENPGPEDFIVPWDPAEEKDVQTCPGEAFRFICPTSEQNLEQILHSWESLTENCTPDGVFLDRIRYPSAVFSPAEFFGCACPRCRSGLMLGQPAEHALAGRIHREASLDWAIPSHREGLQYTYADPALERLADWKRETITQAVRTLSGWFHARNLAVGIDTFAPALADLVGQDLKTLLSYVDFIKPMMYYVTRAPAGVPFELEAYGQAMTGHLSALWGTDLLSASSMAAQLRALTRQEGQVYPGIEINRMPGLCDVTEQGLREAIRQVHTAGCQTVVLSWNVMQAREEDLLFAADCLKEM